MNLKLKDVESYELQICDQKVFWNHFILKESFVPEHAISILWKIYLILGPKTFLSIYRAIAALV